MTDIELILTMLGEATTTKLHRDRDSKGFAPLKKDAKDGGKEWKYLLIPHSEVQLNSSFGYLAVKRKVVV
jgi:hypothetical protein